VLGSPAGTVVNAGVVPPLPKNAMYRVKGLTGTLNTDDVHQTMDARQRELDACISQVRRREAYIHGEIRFALAVDASGHVAQARTIASDIGHFALERCITEVVTHTQFPEPDGDATANVEWGMQVLGAYEPSDPIDASPLAQMLSKRWAKLRERCELKRGRGRARNQVTLYVGTGGRVLSVGLVPATDQDDEKLDCALEGLRDWRLPKPKRRSKLTFALRCARSHPRDHPKFWDANEFSHARGSPSRRYDFVAGCAQTHC